MIKAILSFFTAILLMMNINIPLLVGNRANVNTAPESEIQPETWALTDGLGRQAPLYGEVKDKDTSKFVGLFYWTWHTQQSAGKSAKNVTQILAKNPEAVHDINSPAWEGTYSGYPYFWDEPIWGYYIDTDEYVLRKNAELIADAGVDVIFFDCTNGAILWEESYEKLFEVFEKAKNDGVNVPQIAFMLPFWGDENTVTDLINLYNDVYSKGRYEDLWFIWDGKPLVMGDKSALDLNDPVQKEIYSFFTFRKGEASYFADDTFVNKETWGWCSDYPQTKFGMSLNGDIEEMCVSVAQNASGGELAAMNCVDIAQGRGFSKYGYAYSYEYGEKKIKVSSNTKDAYLYGVNFQQQWDYAISRDPEFIFVTGWNEWIAGRWDEWEGTVNAFPDQFNYEFSRDCEPSAGIQKDYYYCQLCENIRRFKGIGEKVEAVDGVKTYYHYTNSVPERNSRGWGDLYYENKTLRNDFIRAEVSHDSKNITLKIYTKDNITAYTDSAWMRVFIDTDDSGVNPNWEGFEYVINRENATENTVAVEKSTGGWNFVKTGSAHYTVNGNEMEIIIPLTSLGLTYDTADFNFKLSDNMQTDGDIMDFYKNGDVAPGGRFTFVYSNKERTRNTIC